MSAFHIGFRRAASRRFQRPLGLVVLFLLAWPVLVNAQTHPQALVSLQNDFLRVDASDSGSYTGAFVIGTTGGDPSTANDDNARLLYGFAPNGQSNPWTSFVTLRLLINGAPSDYVLYTQTPSAAPSVVGNEIVTIWSIQGVRVEQHLSLVNNPYTGRPDTTRIEHVLVNESGQVMSAGVRVMFDVEIGGNDGAPYFIPGAGNLTNEREFTAVDMPPYWRAFESPTFDPALLKGQGLLTGGQATTPDRFIVARWGGPRSS